MFSFFRRKTTIPRFSVPEWASFFSEDEYSIFLYELDKYFARQHIAYELMNAAIGLDEEHFGSDKLGLANITQVCKQKKTRDYKRTIVDHFNTLRKSHQFSQKLEKELADFEKVKKYLGVRLYDIDYVAQIGKEQTIGKDFAGNIYAMLVLDLPHSVISIQPEQADKWQRPEDELFQLGLRNIKTNYPIKISRQKMKDYEIWFAQGNHFFTPNIVFDLHNHPKLIGSRGSVIAIPHRHAAIFYPIENLDVLTAINGLMPIVHGMNAEGPGSLSDNLFWYKDGTFTQLPYTIDNNSINFFPPDNFVELLNSLEK